MEVAAPVATALLELRLERRVFGRTVVRGDGDRSGEDLLFVRRDGDTAHRVHITVHYSNYKHPSTTHLPLIHSFSDLPVIIEMRRFLMGCLAGGAIVYAGI
jgi:hypothetical protein